MMMKKKNAPAVIWITTLALLLSTCASFTFNQRTAAQSANRFPAQREVVTDKNFPLLSRYATDLSLLALRGKLETPRGHEADIARVIESLSTSGKTPVVVGESDLDRDAIACGVAMEIAFGDVPATLRNRRVFRLSLDALAKGAPTSDEFASRVQAVFAEAEQAEGRIVLFVDQLNQYAGARATLVASSAVKAAIESSHLQIVGGANPEAYSQYIASDESLAKLFEPISIDQFSNNPIATIDQDQRQSPIKEEFEGEKISSDMRELMKSAGPNGRVTAILQVNDVHNTEVSALLKRYGVSVSESMAQLGAIKVDLPVKAIEALAANNATNYLSPDVTLESFGHVTATTGTDQIRNAPGLLAGLLGANAIDGTGIGIAILDSGIDGGHA